MNKHQKSNLYSLYYRNNELIVHNENIQRKYETSQKMISQLNDHMIDIQYKSDKLIERKTLEFNQQSNSLLMEIEDYYTKLINKHLQIDHLNKVIQLKEDDETQKNQELFVTKFTVKVLEGQNEEINEKLEELEMRYDELTTLYENLEPSLIKFQKENKKLKRQNGNFYF